ncbi:hypothetical protein AKJ16_DCAP22277 [Drosera capensis]
MGGELGGGGGGDIVVWWCGRGEEMMIGGSVRAREGGRGDGVGALGSNSVTIEDFVNYICIGLSREINVHKSYANYFSNSSAAIVVVHQFPRNRIHEHLTSMGIVSGAIAVMGKVEFGSLITAHLITKKRSHLMDELGSTYRKGNIEGKEIEGLHPWLAILIQMLFRNHGLGRISNWQLFKTRKDLDRYLAYAERSKVPRECAEAY